MNPDSDIVGHLQFVKVSVTHDGGPSNVQSSGHLTATSAQMLIVELRRAGYFIEKVDHSGALDDAPKGTETMKPNPYLIDGPALISFSGGRTSGYMLRRILDAYNGALPADVHVVFAGDMRVPVPTINH